eukprot:scaffold38796_cov65-Phaeocystis_antarctica.AAC.5
MSSVSGPRAQRHTEKGGHSVQLGARVEDPRRSHEEHVARKPAHASRPAEVNMLMSQSSIRHVGRKPAKRCGEHCAGHARPPVQRRRVNEAALCRTDCGEGAEAHSIEPKHPFAGGAQPEAAGERRP